MMKSKILSLLSLLLLACQKEYSEIDFHNSKWESDEGSTIYFCENDSCFIYNLKWNLIYTCLDDSIWNDQPDTFKADWKIVDTSLGYQRIEFGFNSFSFNFNIDNINHISTAIGDPDEGNYYTFMRKE